MRKKLAMLFKILATGTFSLFLAACYGMVMQWKKITALYSGSGVKDLKVTMFEGGSECAVKTTDAFGVADFTLEMTGTPLNVSIEDVDGAANGGLFKTVDLPLDSREQYTVNLELQ